MEKVQAVIDQCMRAFIIWSILGAAHKDLSKLLKLCGLSEIERVRF